VERGRTEKEESCLVEDTAELNENTKTSILIWI